MTSIFQSLDQISTGYSVFEKDQVLTHEQLNSLMDYGDDQIRLTRVKLLGVGLAAGLRVALNAAVTEATLSAGVGVTTDGDLLYLDDVRHYTQYRPYDRTCPAYAPFYAGGDFSMAMLPAYELLTADVVDAEAFPISEFATRTGIDPTQTVGVLLAESYRKDNDLCSGVDCDNLGIDAVNGMKLVIIRSTDVAAFTLNAPASANDAFPALPVVVAQRPVMTSTTVTPATIAGMYRGICGNIRTRLDAGLQAIWPACSAFIGDVFAADPASSWIARLNLAALPFNAGDANTQYYYDFLKDLTETYNEFRERLFGDWTVISPSTAAFPKHLLLGNLVPGTDPDLNRTAFYPSPLVGHNAAELEHAKFLLRKLDALINNFQVPATATIRITPSSFEDRALEDRAIPYYYYPITNANPLHRYWSYRLSRRRMEAANYSYHAPTYGGIAGAENPFGSQMGRFSFFRIEGHLGQPVRTVIDFINAQIKAYNLPFAVHAVHAGTDRAKIEIKPQVRFNDLNRLHYVMRQNLAYHLDDVVQFSGAFKNLVDAEPTSNADLLEDCNCGGLRTLAGTSHTSVTTHATAVRNVLAKNYAQYPGTAAWTTSARNAMVSASQFKVQLSPLAKTEFSTPFDTFIAHPHVNMLPAIETLIQSKNDRADDKLLLLNLLANHPSLEHFAGAVRGGTFLLVYDDLKNVVADFMLPYYWIDHTETEADEPAITRPDIHTQYVVESGIKVQPSRATLINTKLTAFSTPLLAQVDGKLTQQNSRVDTQLTFQNQYVGLFRDSIGLLGSTVPAGYQKELVAKTGAPAAVTYTDAYIKMRVDESSVLAEKVDVYRALAADDPAASENTQLADDAENLLSTALYEFVRYIIDNGIDVAAGSDGDKALTAIEPTASRLTTQSVVDEFISLMEELKITTDITRITGSIDTMLALV